MMLGKVYCFSMQFSILGTVDLSLAEGGHFSEVPQSLLHCTLFPSLPLQGSSKCNTWICVGYPTRSFDISMDIVERSYSTAFDFSVSKNVNKSLSLKLL